MLSVCDVVFLPGLCAYEPYGVAGYDAALEAEGCRAVEAQARCAGDAGEGNVHGRGREILDEQVFAGCIRHQNLRR